MANNAGGPHCLADGVTSAHILALEVVLPDGDVVVLGGEDPEPDGLDLRGAFVGSEGMLGIATKVCVRLSRNPPAVRTLLLDFMAVGDGAEAVSAIIAAGVLPAALEMMDALCIEAVEAYVHAGLPTDAAAVLLVEVTGAPHAVERDVARVVEIGTAARCTHRPHRPGRSRTGAALEGAQVGVRGDRPDQAELLPPRHGRAPPPPARPCSTRCTGSPPPTTSSSSTCSMPATATCTRLLVYDKREPGVIERVHAAGIEIVTVSVAAGGVLSGEHGIGLEKRDLMPMMFSPGRPRRPGQAPRRVRSAGLANPHKVLPSPADVRRRAARAAGRMDLSDEALEAFAAAVGGPDAGPVTVAGAGDPRGIGAPGVREVARPDRHRSGSSRPR